MPLPWPKPFAALIYTPPPPLPSPPLQPFGAKQVMHRSVAEALAYFLQPETLEGDNQVGTTRVSRVYMWWTEWT